jgi:hypothetical protein
MADEDLRNADLSHLRIDEMSEAQRAELRRRYDDFVRRVVKPQRAPASPAAPAAAKPVRKWTPGMKPPR